MLPIDEDILITRYGDKSAAAHWYQLWRKAGAQPDEAILAVDEMCELAHRLPYFVPNISQQEALQQCADACARGIEALQAARTYQAPTDQQLTALIAVTRQQFDQAGAGPITPEKIQELVAESQKVVQLLLQRGS